MADRKSFANIFLVAGESSGDQLGAALMQALQRKFTGKVRFTGVGGPLMRAENLQLLFTSSDIAIMGPSAIAKNFPVLLRRLRQTVDAILAHKPDVLVIIDSPEFTQRVARRVRKADPSIPIVKYVAPQVWAWRSGRAKRMRGYIDEILALLPFEPEAYKRLEGPRTTYVGHPLAERRDLFERTYEDVNARKAELPLLAVLPGSRSSEVKRLLKPFGETLAQLYAIHPFNAAIPVVPHLRAAVEAGIKHWPIQPALVDGMDAKWTLFRRAHLALAASGTVTLELALAQVPMVVAYKLENWMEPLLRRLIKVSSIVLPNLIVGKKIVPEFYQRQVTSEILTPQLAGLMDESPARSAQLKAFEDLRRLVKLPGNASPADVAAERILKHLPTYFREATGT